MARGRRGPRGRAPGLVVAVTLGLGAMAGVGTAEPLAGERFDSLAYVYPRGPEAAQDANVFDLDPAAALVVQKGARVDGTALQWETGEMASVAVLAITRAVAEPVGAVAVWLKNPYGHQGSLSLVAVCADGTLVTWPGVDLGDARGWRELPWSAGAGRPVKAGGMASRLPVKEWRLVLSGLEEGKKHTFFVDEFSAERAGPGRLTVESLTVAGEVRAGELIAVRAQVREKGAATALHAPRVELVDGEGRAAAWRSVEIEAGAAGEGGWVEASLAVPAGLPPGQYRVRLGGPDWEASGRGAEGVPVAVLGARAEALRSVEGLPARLMADLSLVPLGGLEAAPDHAYLLPLTCNYDPCGAAVDVPEGVDAASVAASAVNALLQADPWAAMLPCVYVGASPAWCEAKGEECLVLKPAAGRDGALAPRQRSFPSWSSEVWREQAQREVRGLIGGLESSPWAGHLRGYLISSGQGGDWAYFSPGGKWLGDFSPCQQRGFRDFLRERYKSLPELRSAWGQAREPVVEMLERAPPDEPRPILSWGEAIAPSPERLEKPPLSLFEPPAMQDILDWRTFQGEAAASAALGLVEAAREACGEKPIGVRYGSWLLDAEAPARLVAGGHTALERLLASEAVDFLAVSAPVGEWVGLPPLPTASMRLRGKYWLAVMAGDRTGGGLGGSEASVRLFGAAAALANGARGLVASPAEVGSGRWQALAYPPRPRQEVAASGQAEGEEGGDLPHPDVAVVVDAASALCVGPSRELAQALFPRQMLELARAGVAFDVWLLADAADKRMRDRRAYVFLDPFLLDKRQREDVAFLKDRGHVLVFSHAAGALGPGSGISGRRVFELTGLRVTSLRGGKPLRVTAVAGVDPWTSRLAEDLTYGVGDPVSPWFGCVASGEEVVGYLEGTRTPGLVATRFETWSSVYSAAPGLPAVLLGGVARAAGAFVASEGPARLAAGSGLVAVLPSSDEAVTVRLPEGVRARRSGEEGWVECPEVSSVAGLRWAPERREPLILSLRRGEPTAGR